MNNQLLQFKVKQRLNKLDSKDYDNLQCNQIAEAFNKYQLEACRVAIRGGESSKEIVDDIQIILTPHELKGTNKDKFFLTESLPIDYFAFSICKIVAEKDGCEVDDIEVYQAEEGNSEAYLATYTTSPSFQWRQTFCTLAGNKMKIYTNGDFKIKKVYLVYYRFPRDISFDNCEDEFGNITSNVECEFKKDIVERLIAGACAILAGDIENFNQVQLNNKP